MLISSGVLYIWWVHEVCCCRAVSLTWIGSLLEQVKSQQWKIYPMDHHINYHPVIYLRTAILNPRATLRQTYELSISLHPITPQPNSIAMCEAFLARAHQEHKTVPCYVTQMQLERKSTPSARSTLPGKVEGVSHKPSAVVQRKMNENEKSLYDSTRC